MPPTTAGVNLADGDHWRMHHSNASLAMIQVLVYSQLLQRSEVIVGRTNVITIGTNRKHPELISNSNQQHYKIVGQE